MGKIRQLSPDLANKIAAGEVVERPASVVKELVENAIDAGSLRIFVQVVAGGTTLIQVSDDGEGMSREEAELCFQRHATSKLFDEADLMAIQTLGFRGEALPSIASISKMSLVTRLRGEDEGTEIQMEGGKQQMLRSVGCPLGSTFEVRDLFFNVPARRKFQKSVQTELNHISRLLHNLSLSHFDIHFRLKHAEKTLIDVPPTQDIKARALQLLGTKVVGEALEVSESASNDEGLSMTALFSRPPLKRNFKKDQYIFVNQRAVKSPLLSHAVNEAFTRVLMKGEEPFFMLFLTIDPAQVDVNVHPAKREVRFQNGQRVHQLIRNAIRGVLSTVSEVQVSEMPASEIEPGGLDGADFSVRAAEPSARGLGPRSSNSSWVGWPELSTSTEPGFSPETSVWGEQDLSKSHAVAEAPGLFSPSSFEEQSLLEKPTIRALGQVYQTFLLAEINGQLCLIDQHTAHERVLYESFLKAWQAEVESEKTQIEVQVLLIPQQVDLSPEQAEALKSYLPSLQAIGCDIEIFGAQTFLVRALPALISKMDVVSFLEDLSEDLDDFELTGKRDDPIRAMMASMACHGAVRAQQRLALPEIQGLLETYFSRNTPPTCPHGRPVVKRFPLLKLEKLFRRK